SFLALLAACQARFSEAGCNEGFVCSELILEKGDFQFLGLAVARQALQCYQRVAIGLVGRQRFVLGLVHVAEHEAGQWPQRGGPGAFDSLHRPVAAQSGRSRLAGLEMQTGTQQLCERGLPRQRGGEEEAQRRIATPPGLIRAPFVIKHERLVEIQKRGPDPILLACEALARLGENSNPRNGLRPPSATNARKARALAASVPKPH